MYTDDDTAENEPVPEQGETIVSQKISVEPMTCGAVEAVYQSPNKGRVVLYLRNNNTDILITVSARFHWYTWKNSLNLNSKPADHPWQEESRPNGFPFPCCGYVTRIIVRVEIGDGEFIISANGIEIAKYPYRENLHPPVTEILYFFGDTGASKKAKLESLSVYYC